LSYGALMFLSLHFSRILLFAAMIFCGNACTFYLTVSRQCGEITLYFVFYGVTQ